MGEVGVICICKLVCDFFFVLATLSGMNLHSVDMICVNLP